MNDDIMSENKIIPEMKSYEEIAEFWDTHSLADYWEQTGPVDFEVAPDARRRYLVAVDPGLLKQIQQLAHQRGLATESLVNLFLAQHLQEVTTWVFAVNVFHFNKRFKYEPIKVSLVKSSWYPFLR